MPAGSIRTPQRVGFLPSLLLLACLPLAVHAELLPVRNYTAADGLPRDGVSLIKQDSRGFMWVTAGDGISRFDGYKFTNYTTEDGLPDRRVNDLLETRSGVYWVATEAGLCRFNPLGSRVPSTKNDSRTNASTPTLGEPMFKVYNPHRGQPIPFNKLSEDERGRIWCGTSEGLFRLEVMQDGEVRFQLVDLGMPSAPASRNVKALLKDSKGTWWSGVADGTIYRLLTDGRVERYTHRDGLPQDEVASLFEYPSGNIWVGTRKGLYRLIVGPDSSRAVVSQTYGEKEGLQANWINAMLPASDGEFWAATNAGLYRISLANGANAPHFQHYDARNGLCDYQIWDLTEDRDGNLWMASACGVLRIKQNGFTGYGLADGLGAPYINSIFENLDGALVVINSSGHIIDRKSGYYGRIINQFDGARFQTIEPNVIKTEHGWGWAQTVLQDHLGEWWIPTTQGVYRFSQVAQVEQLRHARARLVRTSDNGQVEPEIFRLYEDSRGDVWIATTGIRRSLLRWERATGAIHDLTKAAGTPPNTDFTAFREDSAGNLWIGADEGGGLVRYQPSRTEARHGAPPAVGIFRRFTVADDVPPGWILSLYLDRAGKLWIGSQLGGLNRIDDTAADIPRFVRYTTADGLSSNNVRSVTEDLWGRIYVGTGHGVDRLDVATGNVKHYTTADGVPKGVVEVAFRDRSGALWFGGNLERVSRFVPQKDESSSPPAIYITGLRVEGVARRISELGEASFSQLELASDQNEVSVDFVGLAASIGEELHYQYRLEGSDSDWSAPTTTRTVTFASLAPGTYGFMVRAVNADGRQSLAPASINFRILAPIWMRWWFWALVATALGFTIYALYRYRLARLLEVANIRTRIATDLHDEIGSNLSLIAMLSEITGRKLQFRDSQVAGWLTQIANTSRETVDSMSDIVWAVNPDRDRVGDLMQRMRRVADDTFTARDIEFKLSGSEADDNLKIDADTRRQVFMIFKEAVNNIARHSGCSHADIEFKVDHGELKLKLSDDGRGFDVASAASGNGLASMRRRARSLQGTLDINSEAEHGTTVLLRAAIDGRGSLRRKVST